MNTAEMQHQDELEKQERVLHDLRYLYMNCAGDQDIQYDAAINVSAALGLSKEFKLMIGG